MSNKQGMPTFRDETLADHRQFIAEEGFFSWFETWFVPRWAFRLKRQIRHPRGAFNEWNRWRKRPKVGELVMYHDEGPFVVTKWDEYGDVYWTNPDGTEGWASYMNCCGLPGEED